MIVVTAQFFLSALEIVAFLSLNVQLSFQIPFSPFHISLTVYLLFI